MIARRPRRLGLAAAAQRARRAAEQLLEGLVEAPDAAEAGGERDLAPSAGRVSWISCLANSTRRVCATAIGEAPRCCRNSRRSCRSPTPSRSASASTSAVAVERAVRDQAPAPARPCSRCRARRRDPGAVSGRQRRQGRKPASCAAAAVGRSAVLRLGRARRADRPAVDAGRLDADEEAPVEARVAGLEGAVAGVIEIHGRTIADRRRQSRRFRTPMRAPRPQRPYRRQFRTED